MSSGPGNAMSVGSNSLMPKSVIRVHNIQNIYEL